MKQVLGIWLVEATRWNWGGQWSRLLVDCCSFVLIFGGACVQICRGWAYRETGFICVGSILRVGTSWLESPHGRKMGYFPW